MSAIQRTARHILPELLRSPSTPVLLILSALAIGTAALVPLIQSSIATSTNGNVHRLERQRDDWQARLQELELDVATMAGLDRIEKTARDELHMTEPKETRYITVDAQAPDARKIPSRYLPPGPEESHREPTIWQRVLDWLPLP